MGEMIMIVVAIIIVAVMIYLVLSEVKKDNDDLNSGSIGQRREEDKHKKVE